MDPNDPDFKYLGVDRKAMLKEQASKSFDSKKNFWIPDDKEGFIAATVDRDNGDQVEVNTKDGVSRSPFWEKGFISFQTWQDELFKISNTLMPSLPRCERSRRICCSRWIRPSSTRSRTWPTWPSSTTPPCWATFVLVITLVSSTWVCVLDHRSVEVLCYQRPEVSSSKVKNPDDSLFSDLETQSHLTAKSNLTSLSTDLFRLVLRRYQSLQASADLHHASHHEVQGKTP